MHYRFHRSLVGGTFDRFHLGHQKLLATAFQNSEKVIVGIATDELFKDKSLAQIIEDYKTREQTVLHFLSQQSFENRFESVPINDFYGTSLTDGNLDAIFITESNRENVLKMNEERQKKGFHLLEIIIVPYIYGDDGEIISSVRIRNGEIDREGNSYVKLFEEQKEFVLPENEREELRKPGGSIEKDMKEVLSGLQSSPMLIAVGDIVAESLVKLGRPADISIIDGKTRRKILNIEGTHLFDSAIRLETENPAGIITQKGALLLKKAITDYHTTHNKQVIVVTGEEDLLAIPAILLAPLQTVVVYGQFDQGIVVINVSEQNKKHIYNLFRKFK